MAGSPGHRSESDVIIAGLGAMGSQAAAELAGRGLRVLAFDRLTPPHSEGSSHGRSRIIRQAYFEHPLYVPLVLRAYERWAVLERQAGRRLLTETGGLMIGHAESALVAGARRSAETHGLQHEMLNTADLRRRFPAFRVQPDTVALHEPRAGMLDPEGSIEAALGLARARGAILRFNEPIESWEPVAGGVEVRTASGRHRGGRLVLAAGPWLSGLLGRQLPLEVERQVAFWFAPARRPDLFAPQRLPIWIWEWERGHQAYGFPDVGDGVKVARHHEGDRVAIDRLDRDVTAGEIAAIRQLLDRLLPDAAGQLRASSVCCYTDAPDGHFVVGPLPGAPEVLVVSPCSGHGFKFAPVIAEIVADLVTGAPGHFDLAPFAVERLLQGEEIRR
jgi:sarcosine oxidase